MEFSKKGLFNIEKIFYDFCLVSEDIVDYTIIKETNKANTAHNNIFIQLKLKGVAFILSKSSKGINIINKIVIKNEYFKDKFYYKNSNMNFYLIVDESHNIV